MRHLMICGLAIGTIAMAGHAFAEASAPKLVSTHNNWAVYSFTDSQGKTCYAATEPAKQEGNYAKRSNPALLVTRFPTSPPKEEVSVQPGYAYKDDSKAPLTVDGRSWQLFTKGEHAWASSDKEDKAIIDAMKRGSTLVAKGSSSKGTNSTDTYSLKGFTAAYNAMVDACK